MEEKIRGCRLMLSYRQLEAQAEATSSQLHTWITREAAQKKFKKQR
jgi:TfoX/Sxy family transcriptional regulator of competence genes